MNSRKLLPVLAGLVDQSLVVAGEDGRYSMHELVRQYAAERLREDPTAQLLAQPDIDGGLVGGASLKAPDFLQIIAAAR